MKISNRSQIENLARFKSGDNLVTSLFLNTDKGRRTKKEIQLSLKHVLTNGRSQLESMDAGKAKKESLSQDLDRINDYWHKALGSSRAPGFAIFSCSRQNFWESFELPHGPRDRLVFDVNFYIRPLSAILHKYSRMCALLINRREARWYDIFMGEINALGSLSSEVPGKVREGGYEGYESKRIERHIDAHVQDHYKKAAQMTFDFFKKQAFDWLFLGCEENHSKVIESHLHRYLKERLMGHLKSRTSDSPSKILKEALVLEKDLKKTEEKKLLEKFVAELERGGRACSGLKETLHRLNRFEVQTLFVTHNFSEQGRMCRNHKYLYVDDMKCPACQKKTEIITDIIDEAIESAYKRGCAVRHITPPSKLDRYGRIGAFLKFKS